MEDVEMVTVLNLANVYVLMVGGEIIVMNVLQDVDVSTVLVMNLELVLASLIGKDIYVTGPLAVNLVKMESANRLSTETMLRHSAFVRMDGKAHNVTNADLIGNVQIRILELATYPMSVFAMMPATHCVTILFSPILIIMLPVEAILSWVSILRHTLKR